MFVAISIPGILFTLSSLMGNIIALIPKETKKPSKNTIMLISAIQSIVLVAIASGIGLALGPGVGLRTPFFTGVFEGGAFDSLREQAGPGILWGVFGAFVFLLLYYLLFRRRLDKKTVECMEGLRRDLGLRGRILYGGIVEEILARLGLMTFIAWLLFLPFGPNEYLMLLAILLSGLLFGLGHLPSYLAAGCKKSALFISLMIVLNLWASVIFGWLFWQYGLLSAMIAHAMFHLIWYQIEIKVRVIEGK